MKEPWTIIVRPIFHAVGWNNCVNQSAHYWCEQPAVLEVAVGGSVKPDCLPRPISSCHDKRCLKLAIRFALRQLARLEEEALNREANWLDLMGNSRRPREVADIRAGTCVLRGHMLGLLAANFSPPPHFSSFTPRWHADQELQQALRQPSVRRLCAIVHVRLKTPNGKDMRSFGRYLLEFEIALERYADNQEVTLFKQAATSAAKRLALPSRTLLGLVAYACYLDERAKSDPSEEPADTANTPLD